MYCDHPNCYNIALYGINNPTKCYQHKIYYMTQQYNNKKIYYCCHIKKYHYCARCSFNKKINYLKTI